MVILHLILQIVDYQNVLSLHLYLKAGFNLHLVMRLQLSGWDSGLSLVSTGGLLANNVSVCSLVMRLWCVDDRS